MRDDRFERAVELVLKHEGGYANNPRDPGGATNYGISLRYLLSLGVIDPSDGYLYGDMDCDGDIDADDIRNLTREEAIAIYKSQWWDRYAYGMLGSDALAAKLLDISVNTGPGRAHRILQEATNQTGPARLAVDGCLGLKTLTAVNNHPNPDLLVDRFRLLAIKFYLDLDKPEFLRGWIRRALD